MRITIQARGFDLTETLRGRIERRLRFALSWADHEVCAISVYLSDANGSCGGNDQRCQIRIKLVGTPDLVIEDCEPDLYVAIDRAAERTERMVARRLVRWREHCRDFLHSEA